jgi:hypothetical protein
MMRLDPFQGVQTQPPKLIPQGTYWDLTEQGDIYSWDGGERRKRRKG